MPHPGARKHEGLAGKLRNLVACGSQEREGSASLHRISIGLLVGLLAAVSLVLTGTAAAAEVGNAGDDLRTGWYPDEGSITPDIVKGNTFGQLWSASVDGQVYAQPLLSPTGTLVVATENDNVYGLDPSTGAQKWETPLGEPFDPADISCSDITPSIGTTATPVIDTSTNTVYLTHKTYVNGTAAWFMDALDISNGQERSGFPVQLTGSADNDPSLTFQPKTQQQRPGLLLMNGVVYAGFGSHCDVPPWQGWVFGVSTSGKITARWVDDTTGNGAGIWLSGTGLTSDGPGQILLATGNGGGPTTPAPGSSPPASCGECVIRLQVQPDGSLEPVDFFAPYDTPELDNSDSDFGSGGVVGLPDQYFGTTALPHLAVTVGKEGYVYLLNRDDLGGYDQGSGAGDDVVQRLGPFGGVWGRPGVWPGDGGYVYIPTSTGDGDGGLLDVYKYGLSGSGTPSLAPAGSAWDADSQPPGPAEFGWGSGSPVITSDGTSSGSAVVWIIWSADRQGDGGQLRAYSPVPVNGQLTELGRWPIGHATNYFSPGVGAGRIYVGTRDGQVLAFGSPVTPALGGQGLSFPRTTDGTSSGPQTLTLTANQNLTISSLKTSDSQFSVGTSTPPLPATLTAGQTISVPITFSPTETGLIAGQLTAGTDAGDVSFSLSGTGQAAPGLLQANPAFVSLGGTAVGGELTGTVTFSNAGGQPLTVASFTPPSAANTPFSASGAPPPGDTLQPGDSVTVTVSFQPDAVGQYGDEITLSTTDGQSQTVQLSASASTPGLLQFSREAVDFGTVTVGTSASQTFTITNTGGTAVTIEKSKPPFGGAFAAVPTGSLPEGTTINPGQTVTETVTFTPSSPGPASGTWQINGDDTSGLHQVQFTGTGQAPPGLLQASPASLPLGGTAVGGELTGKVTFSNAGGQPLTVASFTPPSAPNTPFSVAGAPSQGDTLQPAPGPGVTVTVSFQPDAVGQYGDEITLSTTDGQTQTVRLSGSASSPGTGGDGGSAGAGGSPGVSGASGGPGASGASGGSGVSGGPGATNRSLPSAPKFVPSRTTTTKLPGVHIAYTARAAAVSRFVLQRVTSGRATAHACVAVTRRNLTRPSCTRFVIVAIFTHRDQVGANTLRLAGLVPVRKLPAGTYRLESVLLDSAGGKHAFITTLRITTPPRQHHFLFAAPLIGRVDDVIDGVFFRFQASAGEPPDPTGGGA
jgi:Abnormal spindle-like microcephaly-assoc'd, ASPM-SPD-2-Hydin/PQQ-like domain